MRPLLLPPLALCCSPRAPPPTRSPPRFPCRARVGQAGLIRGDRFRAAVASSRRQGRCDRTEPSQTPWPRRACGELLTRPESLCPTRTVTMGKGSSRGHHPPPAPRNHRGTRGLPGSPWQRAPARIPAPRPLWGLAAGANGRAGTAASGDRDGFPVLRVVNGGLGRRIGAVPSPGSVPRGASGAGWGRRGSRVGSRDCRGARLPSPPAASAAQPPY